MYNRKKILIEITKGYRIKLTIMMMIILITTYLVALFPFLSGKIVDSLLYDRNIKIFISIILLYVVLFLVNQLFHFALQMLMAKLQTTFIYDIKCKIFRKVLSYECVSLTNMNSGDVISRINKDADNIMWLFYSDFFYGLSAAFDFIVCMCMLYFLNSQIATITFVLVIVTFIVNKSFSKKIEPIQGIISGKEGRNTSWLYEILNNMQDIKILGIAHNCNRKYLCNDIEVIKEDVKKRRIDLIADRSNSGVQLLCTICLYVIAALLILNNEMTIGGLVACLDYYNRLTVLLGRISVRFRTLPERMVSVDRIIELMNVASEKYDNENKEFVLIKGEILLNNIRFFYNENHDILKGINLVIKPGEKIAIVGKSGEGKSTIANLICRMYEPVEGSIMIDGINIKDIGLRDLRNQIGIVHQETIIFNSSVRDNLIYSDLNDRDEEIWETLKCVRLYDYVKNLPNGLDSILDVEGKNMSGGQKQRIALARILLKNPSIIILDEATSALDSETEKEIIEDCAKRFKQKTVIIIAHRFSSIKEADKIVLLSDGKIVAYGNQDTLIKTSREYQEWLSGSETERDNIREARL